MEVVVAKSVAAGEGASGSVTVDSGGVVVADAPLSPSEPLQDVSTVSASANIREGTDRRMTHLSWANADCAV
ncbi:MAG TPA: hypothetical protein VIY70_08570 [Acidimicrobiia bacterium]